MRKNKIVGILGGKGEIGRALGECYRRKKRRFLIRDLNRDEFKGKELDVLHIAIPGKLPDFISIVRRTIDECARHAIVIIHSSTPIGTTEEIGDHHKFVVHSPVRGVHPYLYEGLMTFTKYVGADFAGSARLAVEELQNLGMKCEAVRGSRNTEALKLWDTTAYGLSIILEKAIHRFCEKNDLNFDIIYTDATHTYNRGYFKLNMPWVIRPVLKHMEGQIGGHCILSNCELLKEEIAEFILEQSLKYARLRHS